MDGCPEGNLPIQLENGVIADFSYRGSNIINDGKVVNEVSVRLGKAARAFGCVQSSMFDSQALSVQIKRGVYCVVVMYTLLYGSERWAVKSPRLEGFHNYCIQVIIGVSKTRQGKEWITTRELAGWFGMTENMADIIRKHQCRWLGHLSRMDNSRIPKQLVFGELIKTHHGHGPKRCWRDIAAMDIRVLGIEGDWYEIAQDRQQWTTIC